MLYALRIISTAAELTGIFTLDLLKKCSLKCANDTFRCPDQWLPSLSLISSFKLKMKKIAKIDTRENDAIYGY